LLPGTLARRLSQDDMEEKQKVEEFGRLQQLAQQHANFNENLSMGRKIAKGVDCAVVVDSDDSDGGWSDDE
jgi:hypothetical protein